MNVIHKLLFTILIHKAFKAFDQIAIEASSYSHYQLISKKDTLDFVIADTNLNVTKPLLLFCQGSLPKPLFIDFGEHDIFPVSLNNFDLEEIKKYFDVAVISMPKTPLIAKADELNKSYCYVTDTSRQHSYSA